MKRFSKNKRQRPGVVLILALLIMAAITASTIAISLNISTTASQSQNLDNFIIASLAADSGLERSLAVIKTGRTNGQSLTDTKTAAATGALISIGTNAQVGTAAADDLTSFQSLRLDPGQSVTFDLLKPSGVSLTATKLNLTGTASASTKVDVAWVMIANDGSQNFTGRAFLQTSDINSGYNVTLTDVSSEQNSLPPFTGSLTSLGYRVRIKVISGTVTNLTATPFDSNNNKVSPPGRVAITSTGQAGQTRSIKTASVLWQLPSSPLFNYVLFTEGDITPG